MKFSFFDLVILRITLKKTEVGAGSLSVPLTKIPSIYLLSINYHFFTLGIISNATILLHKQEPLSPLPFLCGMTAFKFYLQK